METEKQEVSQVAEVEHEKAPPAQVASSLDSEVLSDSEVPPPQVASSQNSEVEQEKAPQPLSVLASSMDSGSDYDQGKMSSILQRYGMKDQDLDRAVSKKHLDRLSHSYLENWRRLPVYLGMKDITKRDAILSATEEEGRRRFFLNTWSKMKGSEATYRKLIFALVRIQSMEDAEAICKLLVPKVANTAKTSGQLKEQQEQAAHQKVVSRPSSKPLPVYADEGNISPTLATSDTARDTESSSESDSTALDTKPPPSKKLKRITPEILNKKLSKHELKIIAAQRLKWEDEARGLGLTDREIDDIRQRHGDHKMQKMAMIIKWKEKMARNATLGELIKISKRNKWHRFLGDVCEALGYSQPEKDSSFRYRVFFGGSMIFTVLFSIFILKYLSSSTLLQSLPPMTQSFVCREREISDLHSLLEYTDGAPRIVTITGGPGYGKSELAIYMGYELMDGNLDVIYIDMDEMKTLQTLEYIKSELGELLSRKISTQGLYKWSSSLSRKTLLIFDNWNSRFFAGKGDIEIIVTKLVERSSYKSLKILMTSREQTIYSDEKHKLYVIRELSFLCACQLLCDISGIVTNETCKKITDIVGGVPLAINSTGTLLNALDSPKLDEFATQLQGNITIMLSSEKIQPKARVNDSIGRSYQYLDPAAQKVGRLLTYFPEKFEKNVASAITAGCVHTFSNALDELVKTSLINSDDKGKGQIDYNLCNYDAVTRAFFRSMSTPAEDKTITTQYLNYYVSFLDLKIAQQDNPLYAGTDFLMSSNELFHFFDLLTVNQDLVNVSSFVEVADAVRKSLKGNVLIQGNSKGEFMLARLQENRQQLSRSSD